MKIGPPTLLPENAAASWKSRIMMISNGDANGCENNLPALSSTNSRKGEGKLFT